MSNGDGFGFSDPASRTRQVSTRDRLLDPDLVSDDDFVRIMGRDDSQLLRQQISAQDIFDRRVLPGMRADLRGDLRAQTGAAQRAQRLEAQRAGDTARQAGRSGTRFEEALDLGRQAGLRSALARAQRDRRAQFAEDVMGEPGNRLIRRTQQAANAAEDRLEEIGRTVAAGVDTLMQMGCGYAGMTEGGGGGGGGGCGGFLSRLVDVASAPRRDRMDASFDPGQVDRKLQDVPAMQSLQSLQTSVPSTEASEDRFVRLLLAALNSEP